MVANVAASDGQESTLQPAAGRAEEKCHPDPSPRRSLLTILLVFNLMGLLFDGATSCHAEDSPEITAAIQRGTQYLKRQIVSQQGGHLSLFALALYKGGEPLESPELQNALRVILSRFQSGSYSPNDNVASIYTAGVDATLLADIDPKKHESQLQMVADYIQRNQLENGGWDYPGAGRPGCMGDTSVTQYACLGLWAVSRAGVKVDPQIWARVLNWHSKYQNEDGGFAYCPQTAQGENGLSSTVNMSVNAVGSLHIAMLQLSPDFQPLTQDLTKRTPRVQPKKFGVLEEFRPGATTEKRPPAIPEEAVNSLRKAYSYVASRYSPLNDETREFKAYYLYSLERMGALANVSQLGERDWYAESSKALLNVQRPDGSWQLGQDGSGRDTAFCVLFLTKATAKVLKRETIDANFGDGLLAGGRGLPDDLLAVQYDGRNVKGKNQPVPPLEKLLAAMQNTGEINLEETQGQLVGQVQMGDREKLVGQIDLLKRLAEHPNAESRRTAIWAIGRTDKLELGTILIRGLDDPDLSVMIEARNALCWLSRKPNGFGEPEDPLAALPPDSTEQQRNDSIAAWHRSLVSNWGKWYLEVRPYAERGDAFEAELRRRLAQLRLERLVPGTPPESR